MKFELTPKQEKEIKDQAKNNKLRGYLRAKDTMKFQIGDVLLKFHPNYRDDKGKWIPENINSDNKMAQRYVYVYEDEYGIGYIKALKVSDGSLGVDTSCLADFDYETCRFEVDPEFAVAGLLGGEFDIKAVHKASLEQRKIVTKMNRKIGFKPKKISEFNTFIEKLTAAGGGSFWTTQDYTGRHPFQYVVKSIKKETIRQWGQDRSWTYKTWSDKYPDLMDAQYTYKITYPSRYSNGGDDTRYILELDDLVFYTEEPAIEKK